MGTAPSACALEPGTLPFRTLPTGLAWAPRSSLRTGPGATEVGRAGSPLPVGPPPASVVLPWEQWPRAVLVGAELDHVSIPAGLPPALPSGSFLPFKSWAGTAQCVRPSESKAWGDGAWSVASWCPPGSMPPGTCALIAPRLPPCLSLASAPWPQPTGCSECHWACLTGLVSLVALGWCGESSIWAQLPLFLRPGPPAGPVPSSQSSGSRLAMLKPDPGLCLGLGSPEGPFIPI